MNCGPVNHLDFFLNSDRVIPRVPPSAGLRGPKRRLLFSLTRLGAFQNLCISLSHEILLSFSSCLYPLNHCCDIGPHMCSADVNELFSNEPNTAACSSNFVFVYCIRGAIPVFPIINALLFYRVAQLLYTK